MNWLEIGGQIVAGIGRGAAWGVLHLIREVIAGACDTVGLLADIAGALFYFLSGGRVFQDSVTRLKETLAGFQLLLSDPGAVLKAAWDDLWLESEAIESEEIYEATAAYWARNITVFVISVVLFWRFILSARTKLRQALARARRLGKVDPVPEFTPEEKVTPKKAEGPETATIGTPLVMQGGLAAHEARGGHTLARHVGRTVEQLKQRLLEQPKIPAVSTFLTRAEAETQISAVLTKNAAEIDLWVSHGAQNRLKLREPAISGAVLERGSEFPISGHSVRVVLQGNGSGMWYILTSFPELE